MMIKKSPIASLLLCVTTVTTVSGYIDDSMMRKYGRKPSSFSPSQWNPETSVAPKVQQKPSSSDISGPIIMPPAVDVDEIIRAEYVAWSFRYGKVKEDSRYKIFKHNFMLQMEYNRQTGEFYLLNEFGDVTAEEYEAMMASPPHLAEEVSSSSYHEVPPMGQMTQDVFAPVGQAAPRIVEMGISDAVVVFPKIDVAIADISKLDVPQNPEIGISIDNVVDFSKIDDAIASINKSNFKGFGSNQKRATRAVERVPETAYNPTNHVITSDDDAPSPGDSCSTTHSRENFFSRFDAPNKNVLIRCLGSMIGSATQAGNFISKTLK